MTAGKPENAKRFRKKKKRVARQIEMRARDEINVLNENEKALWGMNSTLARGGGRVGKRGKHPFEASPSDRRERIGGPLREKGTAVAAPMTFGGRGGRGCPNEDLSYRRKD